MNMITDEEFNAVRSESAIVKNCVLSFEDENEALKMACVLLHECNKKLMDRLIILDSIAPRLVETEEGKTLRWDAPTDSVRHAREKLDTQV